ncbi:SHC-transforming protein 1 isoform X1 [Geospiza fortis]|uniref:SHC-transforming protein 1 n=1 Tax=Geospiza fortis TaxID=48883 RepID=A0A8N5EZ54_GEOFO|nr:SHC-transforming protein 1 isoform X2 [Camarhynchus parvulus]XP_030919825.1 SHC-transforming protein 1 isoform X1 [Geospiza fortis]
MDLLQKSKYSHLRNESVSSPEEAVAGLLPSPVESLASMQSLPGSLSSSLSHAAPLVELSPELEESPTTLCSFFPKMANLKLSNPANLLSLRGSAASSSPGEPGPPGMPALVPGGGASPGSGRPVAVCPQDMNKLSCGKKTRVEGGQLGGDEWTRHGSFVNKPTRGWLHPDDKVMGSGVSYHVRYMGCVEVLQSMRALDFNTRTQVTREAIGLVCEAVPGAKGAVRRRKPCSRSLNSILGKSNLKFAGMPITLTISTSSLNLMASDCKQIIANHHMQSISFASGGDPDTAEYVAYVAKDPVNQRACHILECPEGLAQDVISTIGQAFELRFKQYLKNPPKLVTPHDRMAGFDGSAWDEEEEEPAPDHQYYNDFPGKEPPIGGVVDMRLQDGAAQTPNHLGATLPVGQSGGEYDPQKQHAPAQGREKYPAPAGTAGRTDLFDDPSYVNVQNIDKTRQTPAASTPATANGSTQRDLFDMKPFEDALRVPPSVPVGLPPAQVVASMEEQLRREPWYHGKMSRKEAEKLLKVNGDFLVRESTTTPGQYVLTGLQGGQPKHLLLVDPEGVVRTKDHRFESVSHLISYHMDNHLPIISAGSEMCLQQPVERRL